MRKFKVKINDEIFEVEVEEISSESKPTLQRIKKIEASEKIARPVEAKPANIVRREESKTIARESDICAPMAGKILRILVKKGQRVTKGQELLILEAMKMENEIYASFDGIVADVCVDEGMVVNNGDLMIVVE